MPFCNACSRACVSVSRPSVPKKPDIATGASDRIHLGGRCLFRHENRSGNAKFIHRVGNSRTMIAAGRRNASGSPLLFRHGEQFVERTTQFEGTGVLQILEFQIDVGAGLLAEIGRIIERCLANVGLDSVCGEHRTGGQHVPVHRSTVAGRLSLSLIPSCCRDSPA